MPEQNRPHRNRGIYRLSDADRNRQIFKIECDYCFIKRYYLPADLKQVFGDIDCDAVRGKFRCEKCSYRNYIRVDSDSMTAAERQKIKLRRLVEIKTILRPVWRDEN